MRQLDPCVDRLNAFQVFGNMRRRRCVALNSCLYLDCCLLFSFSSSSCISIASHEDRHRMAVLRR